MSTTHTRWKIVELTPSRITTPKGEISINWSSNCGTKNAEAEETARLIVRAVKAHEALLGALEELIPAQEDFETCSGALKSELHNQKHGGGMVTKKTREYFRAAKVGYLKAKDAARAAIALAKEGME